MPRSAEQGLDRENRLDGESARGIVGQGSAGASVMPQAAPETAVLFVRFQERTATVDLHHAPNPPTDLVIHGSDGVRQEVPAVECVIGRLSCPVLAKS